MDNQLTQTSRVLTKTSSPMSIAQKSLVTTRKAQLMQKRTCNSGACLKAQ